MIADIFSDILGDAFTVGKMNHKSEKILFIGEV